MLTLILTLAAAGLLGWLVATWWFTPNHVTFKDVLQGVCKDVRDLFRPLSDLIQRMWWFFGPRVTNLVSVSVVSLDAYIVQTPELKTAIMATPYGLAALFAINLAATISPKHAPDRLPA